MTILKQTSFLQGRDIRCIGMLNKSNFLLVGLYGCADLLILGLLDNTYSNIRNPSDDKYPWRLTPIIPESHSNVFLLQDSKGLSLLDFSRTKGLSLDDYGQGKLTHFLPVEGNFNRGLFIQRKGNGNLCIFTNEWSSFFPTEIRKRVIL